MSETEKAMTAGERHPFEPYKLLPNLCAKCGQFKDDPGHEPVAPIASPEDAVEAGEAAELKACREQLVMAHDEMRSLRAQIHAVEAAAPPVCKNCGASRYAHSEDGSQLLLGTEGHPDCPGYAPAVESGTAANPSDERLKEYASSAADVISHFVKEANEHRAEIARLKLDLLDTSANRDSWITRANWGWYDRRRIWLESSVSVFRIAEIADLKAKLHTARKDALEEAARCSEEHCLRNPKWNSYHQDAWMEIAVAIRALSGNTKETH